MDTFLKNYKTFGPEWNVLNIFGDKYSIPHNQYNEFLQLIATNDPSSLKYKLVERNTMGQGPIQIELFFIYEDGNRINENYIKSFLESYTTLLKQKCQEIKELDYYVLQSPSDVNRCELFQIICPKYKIPYSIQLDIRSQILHQLSNIFDGINYSNTPHNVFDQRIISYNIWNISNFIAKNRSLNKYTVDTDCKAFNAELPTDNYEILKAVSIRVNHS